YQEETDYVGAGDFPLVFKRFYNSLSTRTSGFGPAWTHSYDIKFSVFTATGEGGTTVTFEEAYRADGRIYSDIDPDAPFAYFYVPGCPALCLLNRATNVMEAYEDTTGRLQALYDMRGNSQTMGYDGQGRLISVTHSNGRALTFAYNASNQLYKM